MNVILEYEFNNQIVEFDISGSDVMVNATEMAKVYGKEAYDFLRQEGTKRYIEELKTAIPAFRTEGESVLSARIDDYSDDFFVRTDRGRGVDGGVTWMHRMIALKFAAWLDPKFEVWVFHTIDKLLFENVRRTTDELKEKAKLTDRRDELVQMLQSNVVFQEYMQVEYKLRQIGARIAKHNNNQLNIFRG